MQGALNTPGHGSGFSRSMTKMKFARYAFRSGDRDFCFTPEDSDSTARLLLFPAFHLPTPDELSPAILPDSWQ